ncbi:MAG: PilZ domain-containing protein [Deltaproteobacteria bacterium]|nr:PilZ domain-containing protein [Deltaproteobacteria bacterium]
MDEKKLRLALAPQSQVSLIISLDLAKEEADVRSTVIYDWDGDDKLILAQTLPPITRSMKGREIEATFTVLDVKTNARRRFGYPTTIIDVLAAYELRPNVVERAVVIGYPQGQVKESSVRLHHRVRPASAHRISVSLLGHPGLYHLIDLSLGGLLISYDGRSEFLPGRRVRLNLNLGEEQVPVKGQVVRVFDREAERLIFVGFQFLDLAPSQAHLLQKAVSQIMRDELKARSRMVKPV